MKVGDVFGSYTVVGELFRRGIRSYAPCRCICGTEKAVLASDLTRRAHPRCVHCANVDRNRIHGETSGSRGSPEFRIWAQMKARCGNPKHERYADYGGRGIRVCERWLASVENFIADMGRRPSARHSIDRKDNDGPYSPENCHWATGLEQGANRRSNRMITFNGRSQHVAAWARELGIEANTIRRRLRCGDTPEQALRAVTNPTARAPS